MPNRLLSKKIFDNRNNFEVALVIKEGLPYLLENMSISS